MYGDNFTDDHVIYISQCGVADPDGQSMRMSECVMNGEWVYSWQPNVSCGNVLCGCSNRKNWTRRFEWRSKREHLCPVTNLKTFRPSKPIVIIGDSFARTLYDALVCHLRSTPNTYVVSNGVNSPYHANVCREKLFNETFKMCMTRHAVQQVTVTTDNINSTITFLWAPFFVYSDYSKVGSERHLTLHTNLSLGSSFIHGANVVAYADLHWVATVYTMRQPDGRWLRVKSQFTEKRIESIRTLQTALLARANNYMFITNSTNLKLFATALDEDLTNVLELSPTFLTPPAGLTHDDWYSVNVHWCLETVAMDALRVLVTLDKL